MSLWWLMLACGALTFAIRYSFIAAEGHFQPPDWFRRLLPFVPIAALTALAVPDVLLVDGVLAPPLANPRLWAALVAVAVAARWRNTQLTIGSGFAALLVFQRLL
jgi:branched-subunit amino acid transport protein